MAFMRSKPSLGSLARVAFRWCGPGVGLVSYSQEPYLVKAVQGKSKPRSPHLTSPQCSPEHRPRRFRPPSASGRTAFSSAPRPKADVMGVADGVGGWRDRGIDARALLPGSDRCFVHAQKPTFDARNPRQLLSECYGEMKRKWKPILGSSTACVVAFNRSESALYTANLGDSGYVVIRNGSVLDRSEEQTHFFNMPFQLTVPPPDSNREMWFCDDPSEAVATRLLLQPDDLVLVATDGLFDNMPEQMLLEMLSKVQGVHEQKAIQEAVNRVVERAGALSINPIYKSPFCLRALENNVPYGGGGKPDDITVVLASVAMTPVQYRGGFQ
ncbi:GL23811 [Drosophila persimilis]|uniref:Protein phosphatase PTC7 homolog fig n=1 Tax=Drosophila persimilis TaxID=7234 RepID=PTC71_DROPE|nr:RecName: Full=Protein phosphatase PTC7 homolog fig; AltName: Full=Fos intronic gene protein [Drosophila persimilis]EDW23812.1 GL23811 [Drosophila persimilis]